MQFLFTIPLVLLQLHDRPYFGDTALIYLSSTRNDVSYDLI